MTRSPPSASSARCRFLVCTSASRLFAAAIVVALVSHSCDAAYYGKLIGKLSQFHHGVSGEVYAVDGRTLHIKDFTYDGEGPAAYFYVGNSKTPNANGFRVRDERGKSDVLKPYRKRDVTLTLPEGKTLNNIKWFSVYCDEFEVNFGDVRIPRGFDYPRPQKLAPLNGVHGVSSEPIVVVDAQTLLIPGFSYDGEAPDAKFWVGSGPHPSPQGIRVPDENGKFQPLRLYQRKTIVLTLPGDLTVHQLGHFGVWCEAFTVDFGHVQIPANLNVPPSLKMLGVSPQSKLNCEVLEDSLAFEVRWAVAGDSIVVQLVGKLDAGQYMSFGVSPNPERSVMVGGDVAVAWVDKQTLQGYAVDYFLEAKSQCSGGRGSCPDTRIQDNTNSVRLLNAAMVNGYSIVTYQRPLKASDELDRSIRTNGSQAILWAVGPLNERNEVSFHSHYLKTDRFIEFGRPPAWNCPMPDGDLPHHADNVDKESKQELAATTRRPQRPSVQATPAPAATSDAWVIPPIQCNEPDDGVLYAQMGPTGGKHGYPAITGHVGWGISWYINGLLIPEIYVVRGRNYTFVTEGGVDPEIPARYHPFYITDDPVGGYQHKTPEERSKVKIFAGVRRQRGNVIPTGTGRLCNWVPDPSQPSDDFASFGAYQRTLTLTCDNGEPGYVQWTPDASTPDTVYYQCFTHRYLGWKIHVVDSCDLPETAASETREVYAAPPSRGVNPDADMEIGASVRATSKVTPAPDFFFDHPHHLYHQRRPQPDESSSNRYQLLRHQNSHYSQFTNDKDPPGNLINAAASGMHNIINHNSNSDNNPQLTRVINTIGGVAVGYEQRDPYEPMHAASSYEEQVQSPMRPPLYRPSKPMSMNLHHLHHHHHHHRHPQHLALLHRHPLAPHHHHHYGMRSQQTDHAFPTTFVVRSHPRGAPSPSAAPMFYRETDSSVGWPTASSSSSNDVSAGSPVNGDSVNVAGQQELDQEVHQSVAMPVVSSLDTSNQPVNLVPDQRPIVNPGHAPRHPAAHSRPGAQYAFTRPASLGNPHKTNQLMIIRRPIHQMGPQLQQQQQLQQIQQQQQQQQLQQLQQQHQQLQQLQQQQLLKLTQRRPPTLDSGTMMMMMNPGQDNGTGPRQVFMERKKATYQPSRKVVGKNPALHHPGKFAKMENNNNNSKLRAKIEAKMSTDAGTISVDRSPGRTSVVNDLARTAEVIEPARNTGFDPDSIVIESGFKPIIRNVERDTSAARSHQDFRLSGERHGVVDPDDDDEVNSEEAETKDQENFEPMFVPSPPDRNSLKKQQLRKKNNRRAADNVVARQKTRLDDLDDMEMAADRLDGYYLPPSGISVAAKRIEDRVGGSGGALIAFDGKRVKDTSLARSIPRVDEKRPRGRLTSEVLSRTPQFGAFRGELPPPIPGNVRAENLPQLGPRAGSSKNRETPPPSAGGITKLKPLERAKRSTENRQGRVDFEGVEANSTGIRGHEGHDHSIQGHEGHDHSIEGHEGHDHSIQGHEGHDHSIEGHEGHDRTIHSHEGHDHSTHNHSKRPSSTEFDHAEKSTPTSTGQMVINEMPYVLLTIVLYFAI